MTVYISGLVITYILAVIAEQVKGSRNINRIILIILMIPLILIAGLRYGVGSDFYSYTGIYNWIANKSIGEVLSSAEVGFGLVNWLCSRIQHNPQILIFTMSVITVIYMIISIKKYSSRFELSVFLYITTMTYFVPFNIIRQGFAAVLLFYALKYVYEDNKLKYIIIVIIASTFHASALIMIPFFFIVKCNSKSRVIKGIVLLGVVGYFIFDSLWNVLFKFLALLGFDRYVDLYSTISRIDDGVHILRVMVAMVPVVISYMFYQQLKEKNKNIDILINYSVINLVLMIISLNATYLARINLYVEIYNIILIPWFLQILDKKSRPLVYMLITILFFIFMLTQLPTQANLLPYRTIFSF